jgi:hypothetical protein
MEQQHTLPESLNLADLRSRRSALNARLAKGLDALRQREESGDVGPEYQRWLAAWLSLLCEYEGICDEIANLRAQAATPAPTPLTPAAVPAPPRQLNFFAGTAVTACAGGR